MIKGKVWKFGNNINTDEIIAAQYLVSIDEKELGKHCLERVNPRFDKDKKRGDIILAGENFGCGSSREQAPLAIKSTGISAIVAVSFSRIFFRNSINIGLPILESKEAVKESREGDILRIDLKKGLIKNISRKKVFKTEKFPTFLQKIINSSGLIPKIKKEIKNS